MKIDEGALKKYIQNDAIEEYILGYDPIGTFVHEVEEDHKIYFCAYFRDFINAGIIKFDWDEEKIYSEEQENIISWLDRFSDHYEEYREYFHVPTIRSHPGESAKVKDVLAVCDWDRLASDICSGIKDFVSEIYRTTQRDGSKKR